MQGEYNLWIVGLSYLVAVLASFTALEIAGKVMQPRSRTSVWVLAGSLAMGTGIWSMHFVGMEAFKLPIDVIYDLPLTILSWVAAVAVSAVALWTLSWLQNRPNRLDPKIVVPAGILMGAGICIMHYSGMFAMRLSPGISYDPILLSASFLIAGGASVVTLMIAVALREVTHFRHLLMRVGAALIMGVAITGMHYTGMAAASFAAETLCLTPSGLEAGWTAGPITTITLVILSAALFFSYRDTRMIQLRIDREREEQELAERRAFEDPVTGLYNRSWLTRALASEHLAEGQSMSVIVVETIQPLSRSVARGFGEWLQVGFPKSRAALLQPGVFALIIDGDAGATVRKRLVAELHKSRFASSGDWRVGLASCPEDVRTPFRLLSTARAAATSIEPGSDQPAFSAA